jgi:hypothetical protein
LEAIHERFHQRPHNPRAIGEQGKNRRIALWSSILIVMALTTATFVALDSSLTPEQRIALSSGSGAFP